MTRLPILMVVSLMLGFASPTLAGGPCLPCDWQQRLAVITPGGSLVTFIPISKIEHNEVTEKQPVKEQITKVVDGKEVTEIVTKEVEISRTDRRCVVEWRKERPNWSPAPGKSLAFETDGEPIAWEPLRERLKQLTLVVVSSSGRMPPEEVLGMFKPGTIVLAPPRQEQRNVPLPEAPVPVPEAPAPADENQKLELPMLTSPPPAAQAVVWRDPDQVTVTARRDQELLVKCFYRDSQGGEPVQKIAEIRHRFVDTQSIDYPSFSVSAVTVDGRRVTPEILKRYLQAERMVVVPTSQDLVDPFWLQNFRSVVVVLDVPEELVEAPRPIPAAAPRPPVAAPAAPPAPG